MIGVIVELNDMILLFDNDNYYRCKLYLMIYYRILKMTLYENLLTKKEVVKRKQDL